jgi:hypothetical protein
MLVAAAVTVSIACVAEACIGAAGGGAAYARAANAGPGCEPVQELMGRLTAAARQVRDLKGSLARLHARPWHDQVAPVSGAAAAAALCGPGPLPPVLLGVIAPFAFPYRAATSAVRARLSDLPPPGIG